MDEMEADRDEALAELTDMQERVDFWRRAYVKRRDERDEARALVSEFAVAWQDASWDLAECMSQYNHQQERARQYLEEFWKMKGQRDEARRWARKLYRQNKRIVATGQALGLEAYERELELRAECTRLAELAAWWISSWVKERPGCPSI